MTLDFWFGFIINSEDLATDSMKPNKLKWHPETKHSERKKENKSTSVENVMKFANPDSILSSVIQNSVEQEAGHSSVAS
jgi:hypothetical protein